MSDMYPPSPFRITIRKRTTEELVEGWPPLLQGKPRIRIPLYVVVSCDKDNIVSVFGLPQGGETKEEAVFWAERCASKNGFEYVTPEGWEDVEGSL